MRQFNMHEAKTRLSELVAAVEAGEEIIIAKAGKPVARLVAEKGERKPLREPGRMKGEIWYAPNYDEADAEILGMFEESTNRPLDVSAFPNEKS